MTVIMTVKNYVNYELTNTNYDLFFNFLVHNYDYFIYS